MPKRKGLKKTVKKPCYTFKPDTVQSARLLIATGKFSDHAIARHLSKTQERITSVSIMHLRNSMNRPPIGKSGPKLNPVAIKRAKQLFKENSKLGPIIAKRLLAKEGLFISHPSLIKIRDKAGLPRLHERSKPEVIQRAEQLAAEPGLTAGQIAKMMKSEGLQVGVGSVELIMEKHRLLPGESGKLRDATVKKLGVGFKALDGNARVRKWHALKICEQALNAKIAFARKDNNREQKNSLLEQLSEIAMQKEALFPLLPKGFMAK